VGEFFKAELLGRSVVACINLRVYASLRYGLCFFDSLSASHGLLLLFHCIVAVLLESHFDLLTMCVVDLLGVTNLFR